MLKVLIVDDSTVFRTQVSAALASVPTIQLVGAAANGKLALAILREKAVDLAIVDLEMPEMNGLELLEEVTRLKLPVRMIMFASTTKSSATSSLKALNRGAFDFVLKPQSPDASAPLDHASVGERIRHVLLPKITLVESMEVLKFQLAGISRWPVIDWKRFSPQAIVIGCSTGGPPALEKIFTGFAKKIKLPIFIVQHMPPVFTAAMAERLAQISGLAVVEAKDQEMVQSSGVYLAPGGYHMRLKRAGGVVRIHLDQEAPRHSVRPAVDPLFETASEIYGANLLGVVLTGMGEDGRDGSVALKTKGGAMVIQDSQSCVVYGMPRAVYDAGAYDRQCDLSGIQELLIRYAEVPAEKWGKVP